MSKSEDSFFIRNWQVLSTVVGIIFIAGIAYGTLQELKPRMCETESKVNLQEVRLVKLEIVLQENLPEIKEFMKEIRKDMKRR